MSICTLDIHGNPYLGVMCRTSEEYALVPQNTIQNDIDLLEETLQVKVVPTMIGGANIIGSLCVMNSKGILLPNYGDKEDVKDLPDSLEVAVIPSKQTALGNNILANDKHALVHPDYDKRSLQMMEDTLGVEIMEGTIAGLETVGSVAYATNKGILVHPKATEDEIETLKEFFDLPVKKTTANYGTPFIGACLTANTKGAVAGSLTTGIELGNIEDGLDLI